MTWNTVTFIASAECETPGCRWWWNGDAVKVDAARAASRSHVGRNPGHVVRLEVGKTTIYGESEPGVIESAKESQ